MSALPSPRSRRVSPRHAFAKPQQDLSPSTSGCPSLCSAKGLLLLFVPFIVVTMSAMAILRSDREDAPTSAPTPAVVDIVDGLKGVNFEELFEQRTGMKAIPDRSTRYPNKVKQSRASAAAKQQPNPPSLSPSIAPTVAVPPRGTPCSADFEKLINTRFWDFIRTKGYALGVKGQGKDINKHLMMLYKVAMNEDVKHVTELGMRNNVATYAFIKAAMDRKGNLTYRGHDLEFRDSNREFNSLMAQCPQIPYKFVAGDDLKVPIEETDFLFLDTWHTYRQLAAELKLLGPKARRYLGFHDTVSFEYKDESIDGHGESRPEDKSLYAGQKEGMGLKQAIDDFRRLHPEWKVHKDVRKNNGCLILKKE